MIPLLKPIDRFEGRYAFLSNFFPYPIFFSGGNYPTSEHAFQAMKCVDYADKIAISKLATPGQAKKYGQRVELIPNWDNVRNSVMMEILRVKFVRNSHMAYKLLATGDKELIEGNTWGDQYWGVCNGKGQNWLGKTLMTVRTELQESA